MKKIASLSELDVRDHEIFTIYNEVQLKRINEPGIGIFIAESPKVIRRAIEAGYIPISLLTSITEPNEDEAFVLDACRNVSGYLAPDEVLKAITGYALTEGMFCAMERKKEPDLEDICRDRCFVAVLENVTNPTNVGAIFRSAAAMGVEAILLTSDCADPLYRRAARVSMGNVFNIPWTVIPGERDHISVLKEMGFDTIAMALSSDALALGDPVLKDIKRKAVILGNEGYGLTEKSIKDCDHVVMIPMAAGVDSLNVAAASAVAFWELGK